MTKGLDELRARLSGASPRSSCIYVQNADLRGWNFVGSDIAEVNFIQCDLSFCDLSGTDLSSGLHGSSRFRHADLSGAMLVKGSFNNADLSDARLVNVRALRASLMEANLRRADLSGADLRRVHMSDADCRFAIFCGANLRQTFLYRAKLFGADLTGALDTETSFLDGIDVGPEGHPQILQGDDARAWMKRAVEGESESIR